jgi:hypothetical protein
MNAVGEIAREKSDKEPDMTLISSVCPPDKGKVQTKVDCSVVPGHFLTSAGM